MRCAPALYVEDTDAAMAGAQRDSATLETAAADMPCGDRQGGVRDGHDNLGWISQSKVEAPYSD